MEQKILFWQWNSFMRNGVEAAFKNLGIEYDVYYKCLADWENDSKFAEEIEAKLRKCQYTRVFSINFCPIIAQVCENCKVRYTAWVYDSPMNIRNLEPMNLSYTTVWIFDRGMVEKYNKCGYSCRHLPLAVNNECFSRYMTQWNKRNSISFVGRLYQTDYLKYLAFLSEYNRGYLNGLIAAQGKMYGAYILDEMLTKDFVGKLNMEFDKSSNRQIQIGKRELEFMMACEVTSRERRTLLELLSRHYDVDVYSDDSKLLTNARKHGYVDYDTQMPNVFANSDINLNISLKSILTGIPLRVIDIMGCGGFALSNYQEEIMEYMTPGVDCEVYESLEDGYHKVRFYMENSQIREQIAYNGLKIIKEKFTFEDRIRTLLEE